MVWTQSNICGSCPVRSITDDTVAQDMQRKLSGRIKCEKYLERIVGDFLGLDHSWNQNQIQKSRHTDGSGTWTIPPQS